MGCALVDTYEDTVRTPLLTSKLTKSGTISSNLDCSPSPTSASRLWRPAAQRNFKNQWSKILLAKGRWDSASLKGRSHATNLVNSYLELRYMPEKDLGVLKDLTKIIDEACSKLAYNQELFCNKLVSSYKDMVVAVNDLVKASCSMRCYLKGSTSNSIIQYGDCQDDPNDSGDGGEIPVFSFLSIKTLEDLACELVHMFKRELSLKRFLVIGLLSINCIKNGGKDCVLGWSNELYNGEFDDLTASEMLIQESYPIPPQFEDLEPSDPLKGATIKFVNQKTVEVYLITWINDLNIDEARVEAILSIVEEEMGAKFS